MEKEIVGYRIKPNVNRFMVDGVLNHAMPIWDEEDKSAYFIRGHVGGSLVRRLKELQVLDLWFSPIYEDEEVKSNWTEKRHLDFYYKTGLMGDFEIQCSQVLRLMDKDYEYQEALRIVLDLYPDINKKDLEKELDKYI